MSVCVCVWGGGGDGVELWGNVVGATVENILIKVCNTSKLTQAEN